MISKNLVAASTKPIILALLYKEESYGYQILQRIRRVTGGKLAWSTVVWVSSLSLAAYTSFARVKAGVHFPTDVIAGAAVGFAIGYLVPVLHKKDRSDRVQVAVGPGMFSLNLRF